ncbi:MAG: heme exporter protein CcmD [Alphaproteobacteria bacterium]|nr:heme exporter protein CcmD [Alphaproteobacteria bacterium]
MREFLDMGGYGVFIWPAYGVTALVLTLLVVDSVIRLKRRLAELARLEGGET